MNDKVKIFLSNIIFFALEKNNIRSNLDDIYSNIEPCPQPNLGQYAFKTFFIAKTNNLKPIEVAAKLANSLQDEKAILNVQQSGPYINITISPSQIAPYLIQNIDANDHIQIISPEVPHRYLIEHSQPNTHKELHIGHTRNSVLGDTLCRLIKQAGHKVFAENYHGDEGAHVAKCIWYFEKYKLSPSADENLGAWLGRMYVEATSKIDSATDEDVPIFKAEISNTLKEIEEKSGHAYERWKETRKWSLDLFHEMYKWLDVHFDGDRCESDVSEESFKVVDEYLKKGVFIKSEGTIGADLSEKNLGFCMLLKSDGRGLYATKDLALALTRFRDHAPDTCVYVVDDRQSHHFKQVFATLELMGFKEAERCYHLAYEMVETKNGAMSSRKGNIVPILELIDELKSHATSILSERYSTEWDVSMIKEVAEKLSLSAIRYGMIKVDPESKIIFDMDAWLTLEGNTGPYLQYVYARMCSLKRKSGDSIVGADNNVNWDRLTNTSEGQLLAHISNFNEIVEQSCQKLKPNIFAAYTYELARKFNAFYAESPINAEPDSETRKARMALVNVCQVYLGQALDLLGIPRIERM